MNARVLLLLAALLPASALAADEITSLHPEDAIPDNLPRATAPGPFSGLYSDVQTRLNALGFDAGPVNGDFGVKTQAALAQFQLANGIPVSGMLDAETRRALDLPVVDQAIAPGAADPEITRAEPQASEGSGQPPQQP